MTTEANDQAKTDDAQTPDRDQSVDASTGDTPDTPDVPPKEDGVGSAPEGGWAKIREISENLKSLQTIAVVIAFFVGGAVFALNYFVQRAVFNSEIQKVYETLTAEIVKLQCQMAYSDANISAEQNRYRKEDIQKANWEIVANVKEKQQNGSATADDINDLQEAEDTLESLTENYRSSEQALRDAANKMNTSDCQ